MQIQKLILGAVTMVLLASSSCKKSDSGTSTNTGVPPSNTWTVGNTSYTVNTVAIASNIVEGVNSSTTPGNPGNLIAFEFNPNAFPTTSGSYTVTTSTLTAGQVHVSVTIGTAASAYVVQSGTVTVTISNGKIQCTMPSSPTNYVGSGSGSNTTVSANVTQQ